GNPANSAGFPLSHCPGDCCHQLKPDKSRAKKTGRFNLLTTGPLSELDVPRASQYLAVSPSSTEVCLVNLRRGCDYSGFPARPAAASAAVPGGPVGQTGGGRAIGRRIELGRWRLQSRQLPDAHASQSLPTFARYWIGRS